MMKMKSNFLLSILLLLFLPRVSRAAELQPIPDRLVVLTFDDSVKSHATTVGPLLKKLGFGATFFITEGFTFTTDKTHYMTWEEIKALNDMGFEIGNHTRNHKGVSKQSDEEFLADLEFIEKQCEAHRIPRPVSFAYPGNDIHIHALKVIQQKGYLWARRGGAPEYPYDKGQGSAYTPYDDHPLLIPSAGDARPAWTMTNFQMAAALATKGKIAVLQFHGVPDSEHPWVNTDPTMFDSYMNFLKEKNFTVIALRDLARYVDPARGPADPFATIQRRLKVQKNYQ